MGEQSERDVRERIERLRTRLAKVNYRNTSHELVAIIKGLLDLLADEL